MTNAVLNEPQSNSDRDTSENSIAFNHQRNNKNVLWWLNELDKSIIS